MTEPIRPTAKPPAPITRDGLKNCALAAYGGATVLLLLWLLARAAVPPIPALWAVFRIDIAPAPGQALLATAAAVALWLGFPAAIRLHRGPLVAIPAAWAATALLVLIAAVFIGHWPPNSADDLLLFAVAALAGRWVWRHRAPLVARFDVAKAAAVHARSGAVGSYRMAAVPPAPTFRREPSGSRFVDLAQAVYDYRKLWHPAVAHQTHQTGGFRPTWRADLGGVGWLGLDRDAQRTPMLLPPDGHALVIGGPRSGKGQGVGVPTLVGYPGPKIVTTTKAHELWGALRAAATDGPVMVYDPTGLVSVPAGHPARRVAWDPTWEAKDWDGCRRLAHELLFSGTDRGSGAYWRERAFGVLAPLLLTAHELGGGMPQVLSWARQSQVDLAAMATDVIPALSSRSAKRAAEALANVTASDPKEWSGVGGEVVTSLQAWDSDYAEDLLELPDRLDIEKFLLGGGTLLVAAPSDAQQSIAGAMTALVSATIRTRFRLHPLHEGLDHLVCVLDELANFARLPDLGRVLSEGASQGVNLIGIVQSVSQLEERYGREAAAGFLTAASHKVLLHGSMDKNLLSLISDLGGWYEQEKVSRSEPERGSGWEEALKSWAQDERYVQPGRPSDSYSTERRRVWEPGDVANVPVEQAFLITGSRVDGLIHMPWAHHYPPTAAVLDAASGAAA